MMGCSTVYRRGNVRVTVLGTFSLVLLLGLSTGCVAELAPTHPDSEGTHSLASVPGARLLVAVDGERHLRELSNLVQSATGFFIAEDGRLLVSVSSTASESEVRIAESWVAQEAVTAAIKSSSGKTIETAVLRDTEARATLRELLRWRDELVDEVFSIESFSFLDLDERRGKVVVGLRDLLDTAAVWRATKSAGAPRAHISIEESTIRPDWPFYPIPPTLLSRSRPIAGGVVSGPYLCSVGIAANLPDNTPVLMTAGHCSASQGFVDGSLFHQPGGTGLNIGAEIHDLSWACPWGRCDYADLALFSTSAIDFDPLVFEEQFELGLIWRPENRVLGPTATGSLSIDQTFPRLIATSAQSYAIDGQVVDRIGRASGWSYGATYRTCASFAFNFPNYFNLCQDFASYTREGGDSGGPVFIHYANLPPSEGGNGVSFLGIHSGADFWPNGTKRGGIFSNTNQIRNEIGNFRFW